MKIFLRKSYKGLTLIEVLVSLFIFSIMMAATAQIFTKAFSGYRNTRAIQRDVENAQYALNLISKELRTSTVVAPLTGPFPKPFASVKFYDHSQGLCFYYRIDTTAKALQVASAFSTGPADCTTKNVGTPATISTGTVSGSFQVTPSCSSVVTSGCTGAKRAGKVTISLDISEGAGSTHKAQIQTTSSLRDFGYIGF
ncbi:MAG: prepilin-type N-terminal cleavage/methylation domain-containing protein [Candidatus Moranbacteria bacterium]|nr:prepilin-type N-terminal cleavage/methylation domain-containing protein [Candidatus Moranbacteria bacterium]